MSEGKESSSGSNHGLRPNSSEHRYQPNSRPSRFQSGHNSYNRQDNFYNQGYQQHGQHAQYGGYGYNHTQTYGTQRQPYRGESYHPYRAESRYSSNFRRPPQSQHNQYGLPSENMNNNSPSHNQRHSPVAMKAKPKKFSISEDENPFIYLMSSNDNGEISKLKEIFKENDSIDNKLEDLKLKILKTELDLGLMSTQCEKDALNVQITQEKLDSLLMN